MTTRRQFLQVTACSALPVMVSAVVPAFTPLHAVVIDSHQPESRSFARRVASPAVVLSLAHGDVTAAWLNTLRPAWAKGPAAVAGLTAPAALFCLEQLAWSHGLRVVFHAEHIVHVDGGTTHQVLRGAQQTGLSVAALHDAGNRWPERLARALGAHDAAGAPRRLGPSAAALEPTLPPRSQLLTSWIIAAA